MKYRKLGNTGLRVSEVALGCMAFGRWIGEAEAAAVMDEAFEAGVTLFDTADIYGKGMDSGNPLESGESEIIMGRLLKERRAQIVLATKVNGRVGTGVNDAGLSRYHIMRAVEGSLRRLQTDYIDLYQVHRFDPQTPLEETLSALNDLVSQGKVRYIGCSNYAAWQIAKANGIAAAAGRQRFVSVQPPYSLLNRGIERELLPFCVSEGVGAIVYSPLARGLLTGKYLKGATEQGLRAAAGDRALLGLLNDPDNLRAAEELQAYAEKQGMTLPQLALAWVLGQPGVSSAIVGASRPEHIREAARYAETVLEPAQLEAASAIAAGR